MAFSKDGCTIMSHPIGSSGIITLTFSQKEMESTFPSFEPEWTLIKSRNGRDDTAWLPKLGHAAAGNPSGFLALRALAFWIQPCCEEAQATWTGHIVVFPPIASINQHLTWVKQAFRWFQSPTLDSSSWGPRHCRVKDKLPLLGSVWIPDHRNHER